MCTATFLCCLVKEVRHVTSGGPTPYPSGPDLKSEAELFSANQQRVCPLMLMSITLFPQERPRPEFAATAPTMEPNPVTGVKEPYFPEKTRLSRMFTGSMVIIMMVRHSLKGFKGRWCSVFSCWHCFRWSILDNSTFFPLRDIGLLVSLLIYESQIRCQISATSNLMNTVQYDYCDELLHLFLMEIITSSMNRCILLSLFLQSLSSYLVSVKILSVFWAFTFVMLRRKRGGVHTCVLFHWILQW